MIVSQLVEISYSRYKVFIDDEFAFVLYKGELSRYGLRPGTELSAAVYQEILTDVVLKRAKKKALLLLEQMDRSEANLREKLRQGLYPEQVIEEAIAYVKSFGYINDEDYIRRFVESRKGQKSVV